MLSVLIFKFRSRCNLLAVQDHSNKVNYVSIGSNAVFFLGNVVFKLCQTDVVISVIKDVSTNCITNST